jgi:hypothetical protein
MVLTIVSCGIFQPELNTIIPVIKRELNNQDIQVTFLSPGLHINSNKMETEIIENLELKKGQKIVLLYGNMCHTKLISIAKDYKAVIPTAKNCIEMILSPEKKKELDQSGNVFYLTTGWIQHWREIFQDRTAITACDKIVVLDVGDELISDEELLDFFDYIQIPIETIKTSLHYFKDTLTILCKYSIEKN